MSKAQQDYHISDDRRAALRTLLEQARAARDCAAEAYALAQIRELERQRAANKGEK